MQDIILNTLALATISAILYATYRAWQSIRTLDNLIWHKLRFDPEGRNETILTPTTLGKHIVEVTKRYLNIEEQPRGSNRGPFIDDFLAHANLPPGNPWCTAFVSFVVHKAAAELNIQTNFPKTAWTPTLATWAKQNNLYISRNEIETGVKPQPGWIALFYYPSLGRIAHSGIVVKTLPLNLILTIEGNTNDDGSREGYKVAKRIRRLKSIYAFIRL